jgi:poly(A) polymerase
MSDNSTESAEALPAPAPADPAAPAAASAAPRPPSEIVEELFDSDALKVVRRLRRAGYQAFFVGGCVRDLLLGHRPKDFDIATSALPQQVKETFRNCRLIGRRFRLAHVYFRGGKVVEVATFRANPLDEVEQANLPQDLLIRHDNVFGSAEEDARRRDFTINGLFYDPDDGKVVDHVGGKEDLGLKRVRTIGNPDVRMREDPVRILRAIRFAAKCGLELESETLAAMQTHVAEIPRCAPPRVLEELLKLARSGAARRCLELLRQVGALKVLLPPVAAVFAADEAAFDRQLKALDALDVHVKNDEVPSDTVLLATLLLPLPRTGAPHGPIPKTAPVEAKALQGPAEADVEPGEEERPAEVAAAPESGEVPAPRGDDDEIDEELAALEQKLDAPDDEESDDAEDGSEDGEGDDDDDAEEGDEEAAPADATAPSPAPDAAAPEAAPAAPAAVAEGAAKAEATPHVFPGGMLAGGRRGGDIPVFSVGTAGPMGSEPWSLPQNIVPAETVLTEMVRTARLPRRIAERTRLVLHSQGYLAGERKRKGLPPKEFVRQSIFPEALAIFELQSVSTGKGGAEIEKWQRLFLGQSVSDLLAEETEGPGGDRGGQKRRRRRRGGRNRKR